MQLLGGYAFGMRPAMLAPRRLGGALPRRRPAARLPSTMHASPAGDAGRDAGRDAAADEVGIFDPMGALLPRGAAKASQVVAPLAVAALALAVHPDAAHALGDGSSLTSAIADKVTSSGFLQAWSLIFVSEIGDKTFFIAGLLAMKTSRLISFAGSIGALSVMTVISVLIGQVFHAIPPGVTNGLPLDDYAAVAAFLFFGVKTLKEAIETPDEEFSGMDEERAEAEEAVAKTDTNQQGMVASILSTFGLVFAAELGDRSFLSTIALSAAANPVSVAFGAISAHAVATGIAVAGGALLSKYLSEKLIGYIGGSLFIVFALTTAFGLF